MSMSTDRDGPVDVRVTAGGVTIPVRVRPRAGASVVEGVRGGRLTVRLAAAPIDGRANRALIALLASALGIPRAQLTITAGERSRDKLIRVRSLDAETVALRLAARTSRR